MGGDYKLMLGTHNYAVWQSAVWPDSSTPSQSELKATELQCVDSSNHEGALPCLFNVVDDGKETKNIAHLERDLVDAMRERFEALMDGFFENDFVGEDACPEDYASSVEVGSGRDSTKSLGCGCWMAANNYALFDGPYQDVPDEFRVFETAQSEVAEREQNIEIDIDVVMEGEEESASAGLLPAYLRRRYLHVVYGACGVIVLIAFVLVIMFIRKRAREKGPPLLVSSEEAMFYGLER